MDYCTNQRNRVRHETYVVCCKRCSRDVPAGVDTFPPGDIVVSCTLCGELRKYRRSEVYLGTPHHLVGRKIAPKSDRPPSQQYRHG